MPKERPGIEIISYDGQSGVREFEALNEAIEQGNVVVPIAAEFPLDQAARAHERLGAGHVLGKIVLNVQRIDRATPVNNPFPLTRVCDGR